MILVLVGCASDIGGDAVQENGVLPQWPPAPQVARISYLYSVTTPADAKIDRSWLGKAWQFIKGSEAEKISRPQGIYVDPSDRLYVVDPHQGRVHVFDSRSSRYFWFPDEPVTDFEYPVGVTGDGNGRVYVSDSSTKMIHVFDSFGKSYLTSIGKAELMRPTGLALRPESDELLVVDTLASSIIVFDTRDFGIKTRAGRDGQQPDALHYPTNIALAPDGDVFVTDSLNFRIQILSSELRFQDRFGEAGDGRGFFSRPKGVAVDSDDNIYVVDALFDNVQIFNRNGDLLLAFGTSGHEAGEFWLPSDIFIDKNDLIYVSDSYNSRVQVFRYRSQAAQ
jgi:DNA-binding beta-propeller fold protein YncE